ncbi:MAG: transglutaminase domain-containing protein [Candidatus Goldbacteria bacterium]|nr:transglutaminase domain-containing protein [Candidatus Goldiibacteriota bacterium]
MMRTKFKFTAAIVIFVFTAILPLTAKEYPFSVYFLIEGKSVKPAAMPDYGARVLSSFPLRVKEFTFSSPYYAYQGTSMMKEFGDEILESISEKRRANSVYVSDAVYSYITATVQDAPDKYEMTSDLHKINRSGLFVLRDKSGNLLEKCRAATALLRSFTIPARIVYYEGHYAVEYYIKPLKGNSVWAVMDFTEDKKERHMGPVEWQPVSLKELLNEEINTGEASLKTAGVTQVFFTEKAEAMDVFSKLKAGDITLVSNEMPEGKFYLIRKTDYIIEPGVSVTAKAPCEIEFTMPFNDRDTFNPGAPYFRTFEYYVSTEDKSFNIQYKRAHTRVNPPMDGRVYSLPVKFWSE